jgi:hypothetical protein
MSKRFSHSQENGAGQPPSRQSLCELFARRVSYNFVLPLGRNQKCSLRNPVYFSDYPSEYDLFEELANRVKWTNG